MRVGYGCRIPCIYSALVSDWRQVPQAEHVWHYCAPQNQTFDEYGADKRGFHPGEEKSAVSSALKER